MLKHTTDKAVLVQVISSLSLQIAHFFLLFNITIYLFSFSLLRLISVKFRLSVCFLNIPAFNKWNPASFYVQIINTNINVSYAGVLTDIVQNRN